jgi:hypothetical protein
MHEGPSANSNKKTFCKIIKGIKRQERWRKDWYSSRLKEIKEKRQLSMMCGPGLEGGKKNKDVGLLVYLVIPARGRLRQSTEHSRPA